MVAIAKDKKQLNAGIVCPVCFKPVSRVSLTDGGKDAYGRFIRRYFGWCLECGTGFEVIQFYKEETKTGWLIHKYRLFAVTGLNSQPQPTTKWRLLNELPAAPLVVTGPGGDFNNQLTGEQVLDVIDETLKALKSMYSAFAALKKYVKLKKND